MIKYIYNLDAPCILSLYNSINTMNVFAMLYTKFKHCLLNVQSNTLIPSQSGIKSSLHKITQEQKILRHT